MGAVRRRAGIPSIQARTGGASVHKVVVVSPLVL
jgi:hypothetical protein